MTDYTKNNQNDKSVTSEKQDDPIAHNAFDTTDSANNDLCGNSKESSAQCPPVFYTVNSSNTSKENTCPSGEFLIDSFGNVACDNASSVDSNSKDSQKNEFVFIDSELDILLNTSNVNSGHEKNLFELSNSNSFSFLQSGLNDHPLFKQNPRLYTNNRFYDVKGRKDFSPHDCIESRHNYSKRGYYVLTKINQRIGTVSLVLRFHCELTKWEYASLFSQLKADLKSLGIEWIAFVHVTKRSMEDGTKFPINRLHWHFAFDTELSPEAIGAQFKASCKRALYRRVRSTDFNTDAEYQEVLARYFIKDRSIQLEYGDGNDYSITGKRYVTDNGGSWKSFVRYCLKYQYSKYGVDPVPGYFKDGDVKNGQPIFYLLRKHKRDSGTKSLPILHYSKDWFLGATHAEQVKLYHDLQKEIALSFIRGDREQAVIADFEAFAPPD